MSTSILTTVKQVLGIPEEVVAFDDDVIVAINSALMTLNQLGIGPVEGFSIVDIAAVWSDFLGIAINLEAVKSYICLRVRMIFDPPTNSFTITSMERQIQELEWRLVVQAEGANNAG